MKQTLIPGSCRQRGVPSGVSRGFRGINGTLPRPMKPAAGPSHLFHVPLDTPAGTA